MKKRKKMKTKRQMKGKYAPPPPPSFHPPRPSAPPPHPRRRLPFPTFYNNLTKERFKKNGKEKRKKKTIRKETIPPSPPTTGGTACTSSLPHHPCTHLQPRTPQPHRIQQLQPHNYGKRAAPTTQPETPPFHTTPIQTFARNVLMFQGRNNGDQAHGLSFTTHSRELETAHRTGMWFTRDSLERWLGRMGMPQCMLSMCCS